MENQTPSQSGNNMRFLSLSLILASIIIIGTVLYRNVNYSDKNPSTINRTESVINQQGVDEQDNQPESTANQQGQNNPGNLIKVSVDDDPILGDANAPLTIIEFSDYECPFCKRSFNQVLPELKKNYIDTGKVKLVFRDLPLSFHANANKEAQAANCVRDQGGDSVYFEFHDQIFKKTASNGTGLALTELPVIAKDIGLNVNTFQQCLDSGKFKNEVDKDLADAAKVGARGTPTYFVGKSSDDGIINGTIIVGAQPFSAFQVIIDSQLKELESATN